MRHTEAYKRRAISDTIKMCISRRCFKERKPGRGRGRSRVPYVPTKRQRGGLLSRAVTASFSYFTTYEIFYSAQSLPFLSSPRRSSESFKR